MSLEIRLDDRYANVELVNRDGNRLTLKVDERTYEVDLVEVENGVYSILLDGKSYTVHLNEGETVKRYDVQTQFHHYDLEIIDAESRYLQSRNRNQLDDEESHISSPMPGKVVKIAVEAGENVEAGQTVIIVSAMKMESEYKAGKAGKIKEILVNEGDTIEGNQTLMTIE